MKHLWLASAAAFALTACGAQEATQTAALTDVDDASADTRTVETTSRDDWGAFGLDIYSLDTETHPGDDFFRYVNGTWFDEFEMPADQTRYGSFSLLREKSEQRVKFIIDDLAAEKPDPATLEGKVAAYYNAFVDTDAIEAAGMAPVQPYLEKIQAIETREDLARAFGMVGFASPLGGGVSIDAKKTDENIFYVSQSGLGLGDRSFYLKDDEKNQETREGYIAFLTIVLEAAGYEDPADGAARILA
ncbi:MAG: M13 family metallopeptidase N-terminal domain-containing protein, partial [Pseudomonadota bacterium]